MRRYLCSGELVYIPLGTLLVVYARGECYQQLKPTVLYMDNTSAIDLAFDPVMPSQTKHIARRDLFIRELVERKVVEPKFIPTAKNTADALTKPLARGPFQTHRNKLMGLKIE